MTYFLHRIKTYKSSVGSIHFLKPQMTVNIKIVTRFYGALFLNRPIFFEIRAKDFGWK